MGLTERVVEGERDSDITVKVHVHIADSETAPSITNHIMLSFEGHLMNGDNTERFLISGSHLSDSYCSCCS